MEILKEQEEREMYLKQAFLPQELWTECVVLEDGTIFTSQENYSTWLENKDKPQEHVQSLEDKIDKLNEAGLFMALKILDKEMEGKVNV